jgi:hypothetical protein
LSQALLLSSEPQAAIDSHPVSSTNLITLIMQS